MLGKSSRKVSSHWKSGTRCVPVIGNPDRVPHAFPDFAEVSRKSGTASRLGPGQPPASLGRSARLLRPSPLTGLAGVQARRAEPLRASHAVRSSDSVRHHAAGSGDATGGSHAGARPRLWPASPNGWAAVSVPDRDTLRRAERPPLLKTRTPSRGLVKVVREGRRCVPVAVLTTAPPPRQAHFRFGCRSGFQRQT